MLDGSNWVFLIATFDTPSGGQWGSNMASIANNRHSSNHGSYVSIIFGKPYLLSGIGDQHHEDKGNFWSFVTPCLWLSHAKAMVTVE